MRIREPLAAVGLAAFLAVCAFAQTGGLRVSVKVPGTLAPVPGVPISLEGPLDTRDPRLPSSELLDLPDNEKDLLAYLEKLAAARGIVTVSRDNVQIGGAYVNTQRSLPTTCYSSMASPPQIVAPKAVTDANGNATIQNLKAGTYFLRAGLDGFLGVLPPEPGNAGAPNFVSSTLIVDSGTSSAQASLFLNPAATVSGRVVDANGAPVTNACVLLELARSEKTGKIYVPGPRAPTDNNGEYRLRSVSPGEYTVLVQSTLTPSSIAYFPGVTDRESASLLSIQAGVDAVNIDL